MISDPQHSLTFGSLNLIGTDAEQTANGYQFQALGDDRNWGNPVPIEQKITSWLQDGAIVALTRQDNREMFIRIQVLADDSNGLALAEEALTFESYRRNLLTWTPPDGVGEPCVFTVVMSSFDDVGDDLDDLRVVATFGLKIQALPYVRSQDLVSVTKAAPTGTQALTTIDAGGSTSNWAGTAPGANTKTLATSGGILTYSATNWDYPIPGLKTLQLTRTGLSENLSSTPYIRVTVNLNTSGSAAVPSGSPTFVLNGWVVPIAVQYGNVYWLDTTTVPSVGTTLNTFRIVMSWSINYPSATVSIGFDLAQRSNVLGEVGTNRQLARALDVAGSARTQASLAIEDASAALGTTLVYTSPLVAGMLQPNLRTLLASGNTQSADSSTISGFTSDLSVLHTFDVPISGLQEGGNLLLARVKHASVGARTLTWAARSRQGSTNLGDAQAGTTSVTLAAGIYSVVTVASLNLPPRQMGSSGKVRIELTSTSGVTLDELWIFNTDTGRLTWVECGTAAPSAGGAANRLFLDSPTLDNPEYAVYLGTAADRSDAYHAGSEMMSFGAHEFIPKQMNVFTITSNSQAAAITLSHYRNYHTRVVAA